MMDGFDTRRMDVKNGNAPKPEPADTGKSPVSTSDTDRDLRDATQRLNQLRDSL
jgi:hypothetical protein